jgi:integrase|tara:strand:- start:367 stop:957 length:591 start_codon:yes stop_codon:yes gene_type:complete
MRQTKTTSDVYDWDKLDKVIRICETKDKELGLLLDILRWTGLRVVDGLSLTWKDIMGDVLSVTEKKTGKRQNRKIQYRFKERMDYWLNEFNPSNVNDLIFKSYDMYGDVKPKHQNSMLRRFKIISKRYNGSMTNVGFHSVRKSFGYRLYSIGRNQNDVIVTLMNIFSHSSQSITLRYIGVETEKKEELMEDFMMDM